MWDLTRFTITRNGLSVQVLMSSSLKKYLLIRDAGNGNIPYHFLLYIIRVMIYVDTVTLYHYSTVKNQKGFILSDIVLLWFTVGVKSATDLTGTVDKNSDYSIQMNYNNTTIFAFLVYKKGKAEYGRLKPVAVASTLLLRN